MSLPVLEPVVGGWSQSNGYILLIACLIFGYLCVHARAPSVTGHVDPSPRPFRQRTLAAHPSRFDEQLIAFEAERLGYVRPPSQLQVHSSLSAPRLPGQMRTHSDEASTVYGDRNREGSGQEYDHDLSGMGAGVDVGGYGGNVGGMGGMGANPRASRRHRAKEVSSLLYLPSSRLQQTADITARSPVATHPISTCSPLGTHRTRRTTSIRPSPRRAARVSPNPSSCRSVFSPTSTGGPTRHSSACHRCGRTWERRYAELEAAGRDVCEGEQNEDVREV